MYYFTVSKKLVRFQRRIRTPLLQLHRDDAPARARLSHAIGDFVGEIVDELVCVGARSKAHAPAYLRAFFCFFFWVHFGVVVGGWLILFVC